MTTARLIARHGIFDQSAEQYMVLDGHGAPRLDDWTPLFSAASKAYEELAGETVDSAECQAVETVDGPVEFTNCEPICGDMAEGIAILDGKAYSFGGREASRRRIGSEWTDLDGATWVVEANGDEERWVEVDGD